MSEERLAQAIDEISQMIEELERKLNLTDTEILSEYDTLSSLKFSLLRAIQASIDACMLLSSSRRYKIPATYRECFLNLHGGGLLDKSLAEKLSKMAGFRNLLIHQYWDVDDERIIQILRSGALEDLTQFRDRLVIELDKLK